MDRGESIEKLARLLSADEYGDVVAEMIVEILAEGRSGISLSLSFRSLQTS